MGARSLFSGNPETTHFSDFHALHNLQQPTAAHLVDGSSEMQLSMWSGSVAKRFFDTACVLCALPLFLPIFLIVWLAVRLTSPGPALFRQQRMGRSGRAFT